LSSTGSDLGLSGRTLSGAETADPLTGDIGTQEGGERFGSSSSTGSGGTGGTGSSFPGSDRL
jgi:hypothetical protein